MVKNPNWQEADQLAIYVYKRRRVGTLHYRETTPDSKGEKSPKMNLFLEVEAIGHFRVVVNLIMKARLSLKIWLWKLVFIHTCRPTKLIVIFMKSFALSLAYIS